MKAELEEIGRIQNSNIICVQNGMEITDVSAEKLFHQYSIDGIIKIRESEFLYIHKHQDYLTHFNLQICHHQIGKIYGLVLIAVPGYLNGEEEVLPVLDLNHVIIGKCIEVRNHVPYEEIPEEDFRYSFENIKSVTVLKETILLRYGESLPFLSPEMILSMGVSITKFRIISQ